MSIIVGFKCDGTIAKSNDPCERSSTNVIRGSGYIGSADAALDLQHRLERQGWRFRGGYCYCPDHG